MQSKLASQIIPAFSVEDQRECLLLSRVALQDKKALQELYGVYYPRLGRFLNRMLHRTDLIDEIINDTFWVVWKKAGSFRGESRVSTWIMGIAYRCGLKALRQSSLAKLYPIGNEIPTVSGDSKQDLQEWLAAGLQQLPMEQRLTLELAYFFGNSCQEIAAIMNCPINTVKVRMSRARIKLKNILPSLSNDSEAGPR